MDIDGIIGESIIFTFSLDIEGKMKNFRFPMSCSLNKLEAIWNGEIYEFPKLWSYEVYIDDDIHEVDMSFSYTYPKISARTAPSSCSFRFTVDLFCLQNNKNKQLYVSVDVASIMILFKILVTWHQLSVTRDAVQEL